MSHFLKDERREFVSNELNNFIIATQGGSKMTGIEKLVKQSTAVRDQLYFETNKDKKLVFPKWSLDVFLH